MTAQTETILDALRNDFEEGATVTLPPEAMAQLMRELDALLALLAALVESAAELEAAAILVDSQLDDGGVTEGAHMRMAAACGPVIRDVVNAKKVLEPSETANCSKDHLGDQLGD